jgi:hypothetical protein
MQDRSQPRFDATALAAWIDGMARGLFWAATSLDPTPGGAIGPRHVLLDFV